MEEAENSASETVQLPSGQTIRHFLQGLPGVLQERYESRLTVGEGDRPRIEVTCERVRLEKVVL